MDRKEPFVVGETYHVYTRGVEKRTVFTCRADYQRFIALLLLANSTDPVHFGNLRSKFKGKSSIQMLEHVRPTHAHTDILTYALMPNHIHLILKEKKTGGISVFMHKLMTSYSMYFNVKNDRSGPLFTRPFRSKWVGNDAYLRWLFAYVHLNPLTLSQPDWENSEIGKEARNFIENYPFSSLRDFFFGDRAQSIVLNKVAWPIDMRELRSVDRLFVEFFSNPEYGGESSI